LILDGKQMENSESAEVISCSQCPDGNCPDCPVKPTTSWWNRIVGKLRPAGRTEAKEVDHADKDQMGNRDPK